MDCALELIRRNHSINRTCRLLHLARSRVSVLLKRPRDWKDKRHAASQKSCRESDMQLHQELQSALSRFPSFGYKRLTAVVNRNRKAQGSEKVNAKRVYRVAKETGLLLVKKAMPMPGYSRDHNGHVAVDESDQRWCSDGLELKCFNGETVSMTFVLDCCDREAISFVAKKGKGLPAWMAQEQVLLAVNKRFGAVNTVPRKLQLLTDNGSAYISKQTKALLKALDIEDCKTAVSSPQSNGMAESFVKTLKRDYLPFIDLTSAETALSCLPEMIQRYNEEHPHSALGYLSPREFRRSKGLISKETCFETGPICLIPGFIVQKPKANLTPYCERF